MALTNRRKRGDSRDFDELQHFFQVSLSCEKPIGCIIAPRPSIRSAIDEDSSISALIYRDEKEYVVGHTCSSRADLKEGKVERLSTDWIPKTIVKSMSDKGDDVFAKVSTDAPNSPLSAKWLSECSKDELLASLKAVIGCYSIWIKKEEERVENDIPSAMKAQARINLKRCTEGAVRMTEAVKCIEDSDQVRMAFQLAQKAMNRQYGWSRKGELLRWRPFQ
ncbi:unnamed protein product, partial [marine sediment metagenome]